MKQVRSSYKTVEEMRNDPHDVSMDGDMGDGGARFQGSTVPELAFQYFSKDDVILECGPIFGRFTQMLQEAGYRHIHALDFVDKLQYPDRSLLTFHRVDFNRDIFPYPDNFFDGAAAWGIGEHLENQFHFAREVARVLKPGGVFLFSVPNVFHIISRLVFLKRGMFPRWSYENNHITILPRGVFEKTWLRDFELVKTIYVKPRFQYLFFDRFAKYLPANQWFGDYVVYVLKARTDKRSYLKPAPKD